MSPRRSLSLLSTVIYELSRACLFLGVVWLCAFLVSLGCGWGLR